MKISNAHITLAGLTGLLLSVVALAQVVIGTPPVRVPLQGPVVLPPPDPLGTLKLLATCTGCSVSAPGVSISSISPTALVLSDGSQWLLNSNTIVRCGMSLAILQVGKYVIVEGAKGLDGTSIAMIIEVFDYYGQSSYPFSPDGFSSLTKLTLSGVPSAQTGAFTSYMGFSGTRATPSSLNGAGVGWGPGFNFFLAVRAGPNGVLDAVAIAMPCISTWCVL